MHGSPRGQVLGGGLSCPRLRRWQELSPAPALPLASAHTRALVALVACADCASGMSLDAAGGGAAHHGGGGGGGGASNPSRAVTGLMVHCAADGLALGAAALSGNARLNFMVTAAMLAHKVPMAVGLATYLQGCGTPWPVAQRLLAVFSATAPTAALLTYALLGAVPLLTSPTAVSLVVLFSGGTFLYAATMHILPEVLAGAGPQARDLLPIAAGALAPAFLSAGHAH